MSMLDIFASEIDDPRVIIDDYFVREWGGEMVTKDVDLYVREKYGAESIHVFGTDTMESMPSWDSEGYAAKVVKKLFVPRGTTFSFLSFSEGEPLSESPKQILSEDDKMKEIQNFEFFTDSHIPDISSTEIRRIIPEYATIHARFEENPKFIIPGLSKRISQYILQEKLYLEKPKNKPKILVHVCC